MEKFKLAPIVNKKSEASLIVDMKWDITYLCIELIVFIIVCVVLYKAFYVKDRNVKKCIGNNIKLLIDRSDATYCFRLHYDRVYYISEILMKQASTLTKDHLISFGTCFGKMTKTLKFRLHITALEFLAPYAKYKLWLKPDAEQQFLYGHHVMKSGLGRITEGTQQYQGVIVYSMNDLPLGFGVAAKSTTECKSMDPMGVVCFHQADVGEYIREEESFLR